MTLRWLIAAVHLLGLAIGLGAVWSRARALGTRPDGEGIRRALVADNWWGLSALLLLSTGLYRAFGGIEKGTSYYLQNDLFLTKMTLLTLILALELGPMATLIGWRRGLARGAEPDAHRAGRIARISRIQAGALVVMIVLATGMARGFGS